MGGSSRKPRRKARRGYTQNVREQLLSVLGNRAMTRKELLAKGHFSPAALNMHLRALKSEGRLVTKGLHPVVFALRAAVRRDAAIVARPVAVPAVTADLQDALDAVGRRLGPKSQFREKLITLERLAASLPLPVAEVLDEIRNDYLRHGMHAAP